VTVCKVCSAAERVWSPGCIFFCQHYLPALLALLSPAAAFAIVTNATFAAAHLLHVAVCQTTLARCAKLPRDMCRPCAKLPMPSCHTTHAFVPHYPCLCATLPMSLCRTTHAVVPYCTGPSDVAVAVGTVPIPIARACPSEAHVRGLCEGVWKPCRYAECMAFGAWCSVLGARCSVGVVWTWGADA
jgi:hypothetical protein